MTVPTVRGSVPAVTVEQMRHVDRLMVETFGITLLQMMELAGRNLADLVREMLGGPVAGRPVTVVAGRGHNGGGGLVAARHLASWGAAVTVLVESSDALAGVPRQQWDALARLPVNLLAGRAAVEHLAAARSDVVVDALIGYGLAGHPRGWTAAAIERVHDRAPVLALDVPSGLDATTGQPMTPCVRAGATMTLALPKTGLLQPTARPYVGRLYLADIGVPAALYQQLGLDVGPIFDQAALIQLEGDGIAPRQ